MGQKVSPHGLRVGVIKDWDSKWFADKSKFADFLVEDNKIREYVKKKLYAAGVSKVVIERAADNKIKVIVRMAYGFRSLDNLFAMVMLRCSGLEVPLPGRS